MSALTAEAMLDAIGRRRTLVDQMREQLMQLADGLTDELQEIREDPDRTADEKERDRRVVHRRANRDLEQLLAAAREAAEFAAEQRAGAFDRLGEASSGVRERVRAALERGVSPGDLISAAEKRRDAETLVALRKELPYYGDPGKLDGVAGRMAGGTFGRFDRLTPVAEAALARSLDGTEGAACRAAIELDAAVATLQPTRVFSAQTVIHGARRPLERMALGFALNEQERALEAAPPAPEPGDG